MTATVPGATERGPGPVAGAGDVRGSAPSAGGSGGGANGGGGASGSAAVTPPTIELPKGGGAVRGIGEKLTANPVTGTASMSVPIVTSEGRSGFGPQLTLGYDSGSGNGPFGFGWQLALPAVTRRADQGLPRYRDAESSDVFVLSGAEDLVPVLTPDGSGGWHLDEAERAGHLVRRYRPRVEGLFARIERWTRRADGDTHWRSISKDNVLTVYGFDAESRIADPADASRVFSWRICASYDDRGNAVVYDYVAEDGEHVDLTAPNERHRVRGANRYLKRVRYGNRVPLLLDLGVDGFRPAHLPRPDLAGAGWMFEVVLDYGEGHYRPQPPDGQGRVFVEAGLTAPDGSTWPVRRDPLSSCRSGFEVRGYRLCRGVLMFHHFPVELGAADTLVRQTRFGYDEKPFGSFLRELTVSGYLPQPDGRYLEQSLPPLGYDYTTSPLQSPSPSQGAVDVTAVDVTAVDVPAVDVVADNLPAGVDGRVYRFVDLDGEGIAGVLTEQANTWLYKPNLGGGRFGPLRTVVRLPALAGPPAATRLTQLVDLAGDGQLDVVDFGPTAPGFYERTPFSGRAGLAGRAEDAGWARFRTFDSWPNVGWTDANVRFADITGDGHVDVLVTEDECLTWHQSLAEDGFAAGVRVRLPREEERGPVVAFADASQSVYLADLSGDGLSDLVRIRNGDICYWPNLGHGRFGAKVTMDNAPRFDRPDAFDQRRIRLADTDGSGPTDIVYLGADSTRVYLNESGNGWSAPRVLAGCPASDDHTSVSVVDLLGRGTACLVWSSPLPGDAGRPMRYLDLMAGRKPHLLTRMRNNLGAETVVDYASSTELYLADQAAGQPWATRLPFPVHVVRRVETYDHVGRNRFVTRYSYHHGHFDGDEREFRGFGRVETLDTEELGALTDGGTFPAGDNIDASSHVPPVLTKTWYHTGAYVAGGRVSTALAGEYYQEPELTSGQLAAMLLDDTVLPAGSPGGLTAGETREACRALKGHLLRREVYALDGGPDADRPYTVSERNYALRTLQPRGGNPAAVFLPHPSEALDLHYERQLHPVDGVPRADPRVTHALTLEVDGYGSVLRSASVAYGRRFDDPDPRLTTVDREVQRRTLVTFTIRTMTAPVLAADAGRIPLPAETSEFELLNAAPVTAEPNVTNLFRPAELRDLITASAAHELPYHDVDGEGVLGDQPYRRLIERDRVRYRRNDLTGPLGMGQAESLALPFATHRLAFTAAHAERLFVASGKLTPSTLDTALTEAGYAHSLGDGDWWAPSNQVFYSPQGTDTPAQELAEAAQHFFRPRRFVDPYGNESTVSHDPHALLTVATRDAVGNVVTSGHDYRVLAAVRLTDANGNRRAVAFDGLGLVAGTALMGKQGEDAGDSLDGFDVAPTEAAIAAYLADPDADPRSLLGRATTRLLHDLHAFARTGSPVVVSTLARETHDADPGGPTTRVQCRFSYSDGLGREIQQTVPAGPGPLVEGGPVVEARWAATGWTILNNKGKEVRKYEPFFTGSHQFTFGNTTGVSPIVCYDPLERPIAVLGPSHAWEKVILDPWRQERWDPNDTALVTDPATDPDVGGFFRRLPTGRYLPTWHAARAGGALGPPEQEAAEQTARHARTPTLALLDPFGRVFRTVAHNRFSAGGAPPVDEPHRTRVVLDIEGNQRAVVDARDRTAVRYDYDLLGRRVHTASMEAGAQWTLDDLAGQPVRRWDSRGHAFSVDYDPLRRLVRRRVRGSDPVRSDPRTLDRDVLFERIEYGEGLPNDTARNLRTRQVVCSDGAGVDATDTYDFKGNPLHSSRRFAVDHQALPDWAAAPELSGETWHNHSTFDALNRPVTLSTPDGAVARLSYTAANLLTTVDVRLSGAAQPTRFVRDIGYNARGQQVRVEYGNGAVTTRQYDPLTFRPTRVSTTRPTAPDALAGQLFQDATRVQDARYTYDATGNLTRAEDSAIKPVFHQNAQVEPVHRYVYDAVYRLVEATGREHVGQSAFQLAPPGGNCRDHPFAGATQLGDLQAVRDYTQRFEYDQVGNLARVTHRAVGGDWNRRYHYEEPSLLEPGLSSNRLSRTDVGPDGAPPTGEPYAYDAHGAVTRLPHLPVLEWDFQGRLRASSRQVVNGGGTPETTYYVYTAGGQRARKVTERSTGARRTERCYLRGAELYREYAGDGETVTLTRGTLHVMAAALRVALVETLAGQPTPAVRYQFANLVDSVTLELDGAGALISYEEHTPYGVSAFQAGRSAAEVSLKRFRYTGQERDEESGFTYHGARYYAPWLGRWVSCDPAGPVDGPNLYQYVRSNPCRLRDPGGTQAQAQEDVHVPDPLPPDTLHSGQQGQASGPDQTAANGPPGGDPGQPAAPPGSAAGGGAAEPGARVASAADPDRPAAAGAPAGRAGDGTPGPTSRPSGPTRAAEPNWLNRITKVHYESWHSRNTLSYILAVVFVIVALAIVIPLSRFSQRDPAWLRVVQIFGTAAALAFMAYRGITDFGAERGSDAARKAEAGDRKPLDLWSIVHTSAGVVMGLWHVPFPVMAGMTLVWEVFEMAVPGFGDGEINANRITDISLAWAGWFVFAGMVSLATDQRRLPLGFHKEDYTRDRLFGQVAG